MNRLEDIARDLSDICLISTSLIFGSAFVLHNSGLDKRLESYDYSAGWAAGLTGVCAVTAAYYIGKNVLKRYSHRISNSRKEAKSGY